MSAGLLVGQETQTRHVEVSRAYVTGATRLDTRLGGGSLCVGEKLVL